MTQPLQFNEEPANSRMSPRMHIVVSCSNTKRAPIPEYLKVRSLPRGSTSDRFRTWVDRLQSEVGEPKPAVGLYGGDHWQVASQLPLDAALLGFDADLWISSAGYGLIHSSDSILPYAATFSSGSPDTIGTATECVQWWELLSTQFRNTGHPRTLTELATLNPESPLLMVAAPSYLQAVKEDLKTARARTGDPDNLLIFSAGASTSTELSDNLVPLDSRLQQIAGGSMVSLNARAAHTLLSRGSADQMNMSGASALFMALLEELHPPSVVERERLSDFEVTEYIARKRRAKPGSSATQLLRALRDEGYACEQHRFHRLYWSAVQQS